MSEEKCLTVKELIELLSKYPQDFPVWAEVWDGYERIKKSDLLDDRVMLGYIDPEQE